MKNDNLSWIYRIGRQVERAWDRHRRSPSSFPQIARAVLEREDWKNRSWLELLAEWFLSNSNYPEQLDDTSEFGNPPLTLYRDRSNQFVIDVYLWNHAHTNIHDHGFSGVGAIVSGESIIADHGFSIERSFPNGFAIGSLSATGASLRREGHIFDILPGPEHIHQVIHVGHPTITLVIRTSGNLGVGQSEYYKQGFRLPARIANGSRVRKSLRLYDSLDSIRPDLAENFVACLPPQLGTAEAIFFLLQLARRGRFRDGVLIGKVRLCPVLETRREAVTRLLQETVKEQYLERMLTTCSSTRSELRFLLALLLVDDGGVLTLDFFKGHYGADALQRLDRMLALVGRSSRVSSASRPSEFSPLLPLERGLEPKKEYVPLREL